MVGPGAVAPGRFFGGIVMAQYEHLPIYKLAFDLQIYFETIVRNFSRLSQVHPWNGPAQSDVGGVDADCRSPYTMIPMCHTGIMVYGDS
jgi:hypothetical protein